MSQGIALRRLYASAETATANNFDKHMDLISKKVSVTGVPGFEHIGYDAWTAQCQHEFAGHEVQSVHYDGLKMLASTAERVMFKTWETVEASDGTVNAHGIRGAAGDGGGGKWRLLQ